MARHRNVRNINLQLEELGGPDDIDHYGTSFEESCLSPNSSQYIFHRNVHYLETKAHREEDKFLEEDEEDNNHHDDDAMFQMDDYAQTKSKKSQKQKGDQNKNSSSSATASQRFKSSKSSELNGVVSTDSPRTVQAQKKKAGSGAAVAQDLCPGVRNVRISDSSSSSSSSSSSGGKIVSPKSRTKDEVCLSSNTTKSAVSSISNIPTKSLSPPASIASPPVKIRERPAGGKCAINLIIIGHVDAGKSTLMGHLLYLLGSVNQKTMHKYRQESQKLGKSSFAFAWVLDESSEERARGVTMDIAKTRFETEHKQIILLDAPGHKDFVPNMISGATQADAAVLVANATKGEFETGFDLGGQTREHTMLVRSLGVGQLGVAVNKLDTVGWSQERFEEIKTMLKQFLKQTGFTKVDFIPVAGLSGENLMDRPPPEHPLSQWYKGPTLVELIDSFAPPTRSTDKPLRLCISNVYKGVTGNFTVEGKVETGSIEVGDRVVIMPNGEVAQVKTVQGDEGMDSRIAYAGDQCLVTLLGSVDTSSVSAGHVICHVDSPVPVVSRFEARLVLFNVSLPVIPGFPAALHSQSACESASVSRLISQLDKSTGEVLKTKPRCLPKNSSGIVEIKIDRPLCLETYADFKELGRITLRSSGETVAAGLITKIL